MITVIESSDSERTFRTLKQAAEYYGSTYVRPGMATFVPWMEKLGHEVHKNGRRIEAEEYGAMPEKAIEEALEEQIPVKESKQQEEQSEAEAPKAKKQHRQFKELLLHVSTQEPVMMIGPAGSGKTTAALKVAEHLNVAFYPQSVGAQTTKSDLLGFIDANGQYRRTIFRDAYENGGLYLMDEVDAGNPNTVTILNAALANGFMSFPDGVVERHEDFYCIAAANTFGTGADRMYVGRNQLDAATLDRFNNISWKIDEKLEATFTTNTQWHTLVVKYRKAVDTFKMRHIVSPRATIKGAKLLAAGLSMKQTIAAVIHKGLSAEDAKRLDKEVTK
jgi:MoxR-like ATPase